MDEITGGKGIVFATGTPVSNSMVELYTMQRYLQYDSLVKAGLDNFDDWASVFGETTTAIELAPEGTGYRAKTRFAKFYNLPELMSTFKAVADIQTADMLKLPVPKANFHTEVIKPSELQDVNHQLLVRKEAEYTYRPIQLINPYLYYLLVKEITNPDAWEEVKKRFTHLSVKNIEVTSIPKVKSQDEKSHKAADVVSWWEDVEQRSLELSLSYRYMFVTDITNCYSSIYTHTIAWALMDKDTAKKNRRDSKQLGNLIDKYLQAMQYGQTNGIPQGSVLSDFIAEMVLAYADKQLGDSLTQANIYDYHILRYRDDYRIFSDSKEIIDKIVFKLQTVLSDLNLQLNSRKTFLTEDIVGSSIKPDKLTYVARVPIYRKVGNRVDSCMSNLQQEALFIHQFSKEGISYLPSRSSLPILL